MQGQGKMPQENSCQMSLVQSVENYEGICLNRNQPDLFQTLINLESVNFDIKNDLRQISSEKVENSTIESQKNISFANSDIPKNNNIEMIRNSQKYVKNKYLQQTLTPEKKKGRGKSRKTLRENNLGNTKNILTNFKQYPIDYIKMVDQQASNDQFIVNFQAKKKVNRQDFVELFKKEKYQKIIQEMFEKRFIARQLQLSRLSTKLRSTYLKKIPVFRRAFELKWFPRIK